MRRVICGLLTVFVLLLGLPGGVGILAAQAEAPRIVQIAAGRFHSLALFSDGSLYAWGWNAYGQLGDGKTFDQNTPTLIDTGFTAIAAGESHSLALKGNALYGWGCNEDCQLGDGTVENKLTPTLIDTGVTAIAGGSYHSLALKGSELYGWGRNGIGQLGDGIGENQDRPKRIGRGYTAIAACESHTLLLKGSLLYACGANDRGQLGDGSTDSQFIPTLIGTGYSVVRTGREHSLALRGSALYAWGTNGEGQLGVGTASQKYAPIMIGTGYTAIAAGGFHSLALKGGALYAWGYNAYGQLGDNTSMDRNTPTRVTFPAPSTPDPLYISRFTARKADLNIGDRAVFTVKTGKSARWVRLYRDGALVTSTQSYRSADGMRIWTFSPVMAESGTFRYWAVASNTGGDGVESADVVVNVGKSSLGIQDFTINSPALDVGETVVFKFVTGKLADRVRILEASNEVFVESSKAYKTSGSKKIWTIKRRLTEDDRGSFNLHAVVDSKYGPGLASAVLQLRVTDNLPRIISVTADKATVRRNAELIFTVETNAAATSVRIMNDKNEKWGQVVAESAPSENRQIWRVTTHPKQLGIRKFYAQAWRGALPGAKKYVGKIFVNK